MPTPATDRQRYTLLAIAVASVVLAVMATRVVDAAAAVGAKPVPVTELQSLSPFLGPLTDTMSLASGEAGTMVVQRDPFGSTPTASRPAARSTGSTASRPTKGGSQQWVVSSILFEESRRSAIVNNAWVNVGDPLGGGARVSAIERKHVIITDANGNRHVVPIQGGAQ